MAQVTVNVPPRPILLNDLSNPSASAGQKADFLAYIGGAGVNFIPSGAGAVARTAASKMADILSVKDFGAIGDGTNHPLSERYNTLVAAQAVYSFVTSLAQSIDYAAIQAALTLAGLSSNSARGRTVVAPYGDYMLSDSLRIPSFVTLEGESQTGTVLRGDALATPILVNADASSFIGASIRNFTAQKGTHFLKISVATETADLRIDRITTAQQTAAQVEATSLQTTIFRDCNFDGGVNGINVTGYPCNSITLSNCRLTTHSQASLKLRGFNSVKMIGGSMESGGVVGQNTIDIENGGVAGNDCSFQGVFFEATNAVLLHTSSVTGVSFDGCHFVGGPALAAYTFDCGTDLIEFGSNYWASATTGPAKTRLTGYNPNLSTPIQTVASATALAMPAGQSIVTVSGTTNITSITTTSADAGRRVTLIFSGILTFTDGSNLKLAGNLVTTADDTISLVCDGTNWFETGRSVN